MSISVFVTRGNDKGRTFCVDENTASIGRDLSTDVTITDEEVSRSHCLIQIVQGQIEIVDEGSSNGTFVNEQKVTRAFISPNDTIRIGQTRLTVGSNSNVLIESGSETEETNLIEQSALDTCEMPVPNVRTNDQSDVPEEAGRKFVRIQNDLRFAYEASLATRKSFENDQMFEELLDLIFNWISADRGCVFWRDQDSENFSIRVIKNRCPELGHGFAACAAVVDYVIQRRLGILSHDPQDEIRLKNKSEDSSTQIGEVMCVPIEGRSTGLLGVLYVDTIHSPGSNKFRRFQKDHLRLMLSIAQQAAIAVENEKHHQSLVIKEKHAAVGETMALLSHQVNNILQGLGGGSHLLESGLQKSDSKLIRQGWSVVQRNQEKISKMLLDLVFLSKEYRPSLESVEISELIRHHIGEFEKSSDNKQEIHFENMGELIASIDSQKVGISIQNILSVCGMAKDPETPLNVYLNQFKMEWAIEFHYEGIEILDTDQLTEQDKPPRNQNIFGGTELAIAKKIAQGHGGRVETKQVATDVDQWIISLRFLVQTATL
ncbi:MAG: FHA domain-containing protein [Planctomycetota bacterium]